MATLRNRKRQRTEVLERPEYGWIWKPLLTLLVLYLVICIGLGIWWSQPPGDFSVERAVSEQRGEAASAPAARGSVTVATLMTEVETLLEKPGGYLRNDVAPPGVWLDNMPSWEYGVLTQARLMSRALPALSSGEHEVLEEAIEALASNSLDWLYPAAEKRYAEAVALLGEYLASLSGQQADGFVDNGGALAEWLRAVAERFDELTRRLSASVDDPEALRELGVAEADLPDATPWFRIDNVFFEARGDAWGLLHLLEAIARDYADVLDEAGAAGDVERMIAELELALRPIWSPIILNGSGYGIFANHSLVLANHTMEVAEQALAVAESVANVQVEPPVSVAPAAAPAADATATDAGAGGDEPQGTGGGPSGEGAAANDDSGASGEAGPAAQGQSNADQGGGEQEAQRTDQAPAPSGGDASAGEPATDMAPEAGDSSSSEPAGDSLSAPPQVPATTPGSAS